MIEKENNTSSNDADLDVYIGNIVDDKYSQGTYLTKRGNNFYLYYGGFKSDGAQDVNGNYYSAASDRIIRGNIDDNLFKNGYISFFNDQELLEI